MSSTGLNEQNSQPLPLVIVNTKYLTLQRNDTCDLRDKLLDYFFFNTLNPQRSFRFFCYTVFYEIRDIPENNSKHRQKERNTVSKIYDYTLSD